MFNKLLVRDFKSLTRQKRGLTIFFLQIGIAVVTIVYLVLLYFLMKYVKVEVGEGDVMEQISSMSMLSFPMSATFFGAFFMTYGLIITVILIGTLISSEIKNKQWVLPINAGHNSKSLFLSKLITSECWVTGSALVGIIIHFLFTIIFCDPLGGKVWQLLTFYLFMVLSLIMFVAIIISLNFITKKSWVGIVIFLVSVMLLPAVFAEIPIGNYSLLDYLPLSFYSFVSDGAMKLFALKNFGSLYTPLQWVTNFAVYFLILIGFPLWAIASSKIKATK